MTYLDSRDVQALGWTLVHFLWQGAALAFLLASLNLLLRHRQRRRSQAPRERRRVQEGRMRTESPSRIFLEGIARPSAIWMLPAYGRCGRQ